MNSFDDSPIDDDSEQTQKTISIAAGGYSVAMSLPRSRGFPAAPKGDHTSKHYESSKRR